LILNIAVAAVATVVIGMIAPKPDRAMAQP
jgi:hypothetical protein